MNLLMNTAGGETPSVSLSQRHMIVVCLRLDDKTSSTAGGETPSVSLSQRHVIVVCLRLDDKMARFSVSSVSPGDR